VQRDGVRQGHAPFFAADAQEEHQGCAQQATARNLLLFLLLIPLRGAITGCFLFTSSVSGYIPNPFAVMYGATKAFVSQFAASLAIEVPHARSTTDLGPAHTSNPFTHHRRCCCHVW
jgi:short-subunit dehydrogenase